MASQPQKDAQNQNISDKTQERISNAFANILMKYQIGKAQDQTAPTSKPQNPQLQQSPIDLDPEETQPAQEDGPETVSKPEKQKKQANLQQEGSFKKAIQKITQNKSGEPNETTLPDEKTKKAIKKSGKSRFQNQEAFSNQQKKQIFESNHISQLLKNRNSKEDQRSGRIEKNKDKVTTEYVVQDSEVEQVIEVPKINGRQNKTNEKAGKTNATKAKNSKQTKKSEQEDLIQVIPKIVIQEDKSILQLLKKQKSNEKTLQMSKMKKLDFVIQINLLSNKELGFDLKKTKIRNYIQNIKKSTVNNPFSKSCIDFKPDSQVKNGSKATKETKKSNLFQSKVQNNKLIYQQDEQVELFSQAKTKKTMQQLRKNRNEEKNISEEKNLKKSRAQTNTNKSSKQAASLLKPSAKVNPPKKQSLAKSAVAPIQKNKPLNAASASIQVLVGQLFKKKLITQSQHKQFMKHQSTETVKEYLQKFENGKLHKFDFSKIKYTILDHRRISQTLVKVFPGNYLIGSCIQADIEVQKFLVDLYDIESNEYQKLCSKIDKISGIAWWNKMKEHAEKMLKSNNQPRSLRKKPDLAYSTVKDPEQRTKSKQNNTEKTKTNLSSKEKKRSQLEKELRDLTSSNAYFETKTSRKRSRFGDQDQVVHSPRNLRKKIKLN